MTQEEISLLIACEIASVPDDWPERQENNPHGLDFSKCLVTPRRVVCRVPSKPEWDHFDAWLVFLESPDMDDGYCIIFDEESRSFGLACGKKCDLICIGMHGSFLDTVTGM